MPGGHLFVKTFGHNPGEVYPDLGANAEVFANETMLEMETLGALVRLSPGQAVEHVERWHHFRDVPVPQCDSDVERHILPRVQESVQPRLQPDARTAS